ncbi:hypothetical protein EVAR_101536_1, partial [Eumeta japonica]
MNLALVDLLRIKSMPFGKSRARSAYWFLRITKELGLEGHSFIMSFYRWDKPSIRISTVNSCDQAKESSEKRRNRSTE